MFGVSTEIRWAFIDEEMQSCLRLIVWVVLSPKLSHFRRGQSKKVKVLPSF